MILKGRLVHGLYLLEGNTTSFNIASSSTKSSSAAIVTAQMHSQASLWHKRLGHISEGGIRELSKQKLLGKKSLDALEFCEHCIYGKAKRLKFAVAEHHSKGTLDYIHSDLWGPAYVFSHSGARYFLSIIDDFSRKVWVFILKSKDEVFAKFKEWKLLVETQTSKKVKKLRTDNGLEFCSNEFNQFCKKNGTERHRTVKGTPQQNGLVERMNRMIMERVICLLSDSNCLGHFWGEAVMTICYLTNRCPSTATNMVTPKKMWSGHPPNLKNLRVFGCVAYARIRQGKLESRAYKCMFLGYPQGVKGYRLWCMDKGHPRVLISRDVVFKESEMYHLKEDSSKGKAVWTQESVQLEVESGAGSSSAGRGRPLLGSTGAEVERPEHGSSGARVKTQGEEQEADIMHLDLQDYLLSRDRERRVSNPLNRVGCADMVAFALNVAEHIEGSEPKSYVDAVNRKHSKEWTTAMQEEIDSLHKNGTWVLVDKPKASKLVSYRWLYKLKEEIPRVEKVRYKARLVA